MSVWLVADLGVWRSGLKKHGNFLFKIIVLVILFAFLAVSFYDFPVREKLQTILIRIGELGALAPLAYAGFYLLGSVFLLPCFPLTIGAGFIFGFQKGFVIASLSSTIGAAGAFLVSRYIAWELVRDWVEKNEKYSVIDRAVSTAGWKIVILMRFASHIPYNFVNYCFGMTGIGFFQFVLGTWLGRLPITAFHTYVGSFSANMMNAKNEIPTTTPLAWCLYGIGWVATIAVTVFIVKAAREALNERIRNPASGE